MERDKFNSRLGFILVSAGCAIGIGNVWRFPYVAGTSGGGLFVLLYVFFLVIMGLPILMMEYALGRSSRKSIVKAYQTLEKPGQKWHLHGYMAVIGNYLLIMFYSVVSGWMLYYFYKMAAGGFAGKDTVGVSAVYEELMSQPVTMTICMVIVVAAGCLICSMGFQNGVEKMSKVMMIALLCIMVLLAVRSILLPGSSKGIAFYLIPDMAQVKSIGIGNVIVSAMNQAFFTLSLGMGSMTIFGSYLDKERTLAGEAMTVASLDTFVAFVSGLIVFPACFAFGVSPDSGPRLIFITLPNIFNAMQGGRIWGSLFFVFMTFAAFSTIIAVFENIIKFSMEIWGWSRKKASAVNLVILMIASVPCVLGFNLWAGFEPLRAGNNIMDLEDFIVSNIILPIGSLTFILFFTRRAGWGWDNFMAEVNEGKGPKISNKIRFYCTYILPCLVLLIIIYGLISYFK